MKSLYKLEALKWIKNPLNWIFSIGLPVVLTLILGFTVGKYEIKGINVMNFIFPQVVLLIVLTQTLTGFPISMAYFRISRQLKHLSMANVSKGQYLFVQGLFNYSAYFLIFLLCFILSATIFKIDLTYQMILSTLFLPICFYIVHFCLGVGIANFSKSLNQSMMITLIMFYFLMLVSGIALPLSILPDWVKYIQYLTPTGCALIILNNCANALNQSQEWFAYLVLAVYATLFAYLAFKFFAWE